MDVLALWRESGKWWDGEAEKEWVRFLDEHGKLVEECCELSFEKESMPFKRVAEDIPTYTVDYMFPNSLKRNAVSAAKGISPGDRERAVHLHCLSALSFGRSSMHPEQIAALAHIYGMKAVALTDAFSLAGVVDFCRAAKTLGIKPIIGATLEIDSGGKLVLLAASQHGYRNLSRLITHCHLRQPRLFPLWEVENHGGDLSDIVCLTGGHGGPINRLLMHKEHMSAKALMGSLLERFGSVYVEIERTFQPWEVSVNGSLLDLAKSMDVRAIAGGSVTHAVRSDFQAQDSLLCAETLCTVEEIIGRKPQRHSLQPQVAPWPLRSMNSERYFHTARETEALFEPELIEAACELADSFPDDPLPPKPQFPKFCAEPEKYLCEIVIRNSKERYPQVGVEHKYRINGELNRICSLGYASNFLAIWEACRWAKSQGILYSARGSAVDSAIAYCLELTPIDAIKHNLHFDRFLPDDGSKKPDIDVDFEAARRDEVRNFLSDRYGKDKVATVSAIATYQGRGIVRKIGKALMIPEDTLGYLAKRLHGSVSGQRLRQGIAERPELRDSGIPIERFMMLFELAQRIDGLPRHMGAHSSGVVITDTPLCETVPIMESGRDGVQIIQWDKYSAKHYFNKLDILCLRGLDVMAGTQRQIRESGVDFDSTKIAMDDQEVFEDFRKGNLIGTPQSASPAMRQAHIRLRSENLHDVSLVQAGIRPGVGGAVKINELIRRRRSGEKHIYSHPLFQAILGISYGIIVFQEQVDQLLQAFCGYTSGEAEDIRDAIHKQRADSWDKSVQDDVLARCAANGFSKEIGEEVLELVSGFKGYGFAQGHALAFAEISIRCVYCQQHYPAEYFAALLSNQPAGYYGPGTIANEARNRGVRILPLDVNKSSDLFTVEDGNIRVGLIQQFSLSRKTRERISGRPYASMFDFCARVRPAADELENLILAGFFDSLHSNRRATLWAAPDAVQYASARNKGGLCDIPEPEYVGTVEDFSEYEKAVLERSMLGLDIKKHLMAFERERIETKGGVTCAHAQDGLKDQETALVVGHAMRLRFPPTASGRRVVFFDLEDETGLLNVTCFDDTYQRDGHAIICSPFVTLRGLAQARDGHLAFLAQRVFPYKPMIDKDGFAEQRKAVHSEDFIHRGGR
ncbi:MAG: DNA polymerase III subunit alpha [Armatimonadetes bacterium]|nr:DNA polymerase III subunit alpha [Armatimonadota bacterium]